MPDDALTVKLLSDFKRTSESLEAGVNLSPETMAKFLGKMGNLIVHCVESMWSDDSLKQRVCELLSERCETCPNTAYITLLKQGMVRPTEKAADHDYEHEREHLSPGEVAHDKLSWSFVIREYGRTLIWAIASIIIAAIIFGQLPTLSQFVHEIKTEAKEGYQ